MEWPQAWADNVERASKRQINNALMGDSPGWAELLEESDD